MAFSVVLADARCAACLSVGYVHLGPSFEVGCSGCNAWQGLA